MWEQKIRRYNFLHHLAIYQNKHLTKQLEPKEQDCVGYQDIIAEGEQRLLAKTQKVSQE